MELAHINSMTSRPPSYNSNSAQGGVSGGSFPQHDQDNDKDDRFVCNICLDPVRDPVTTLCGHLFCWPCLYRWLESQHSTCPICLAGVSKENVIPLFIKGAENDPRNKSQEEGVPNRPNAQRPEAPARNSGLGTNTVGNGQFAGLSFTAGRQYLQFPCVFHFDLGFGFFPSLFGLQFQSFVDPAPSAQGRQLTPMEEEQAQISRVLIAMCCAVVVFLFVL